jgi:hypothetical protein
MMAGFLCNGDSPLQVVQTQFGNVTFHRSNNPNLILGDVQQNDKMIAHALGQMSLKEREKVYHDMHGVADEIHEEPTFVAERLQEMRDELFTLKSQPSGWALQLAESIDPNYVNNRKFLLVFLRCEGFVAIKAAGRMTRNLEWKFSLFGASKLCKDIELADLPEEDVKNLKKGYFQLLLERDRAGRAVFIVVQKGQAYPSPESFVSTQVQYMPVPSTMYILGCANEFLERSCVSHILFLRFHSTILLYSHAGSSLILSVPFGRRIAEKGDCRRRLSSR